MLTILFLYCTFVVTPIDKFNYSYYHGIIKNTYVFEENPGFSYDNSTILEYVKTDDENDKIGVATWEELPFKWKYNHKNTSKTYQLPKNHIILVMI